MRDNKIHDEGDAFLNTVSSAFTHELRSLVTTERDEAMMSMPTDRVMRALKRASTWKKEEVWFNDLFSWFRPVFAAGVFVIIVLAVYNVRLATSSGGDFEQTATEKVLGLPPITVASAYDFTLDDHH